MNAGTLSKCQRHLLKLNLANLAFVWAPYSFGVQQYMVDFLIAILTISFLIAYFVAPCIETGIL